MTREKGYTKKNFLKGILIENPLLVSILGTCPALATTKTIEAALGMGILFLIVLICSNILVSLLRKIISEEIRTPAYIVIIATFVTIVKMLTNAFLPELYSTLGVFISLIVVNCIVLGRAEAFASKNNVFDSFIDALGMGIGYTLALLLLAFFREILGSGAISFGAIFTFIPAFKSQIIPKNYAISLFQTPAGAFIVFGLVLAIIAFIKNRKSELKANLAKQEKAKKTFLDSKPEYRCKFPLYEYQKNAIVKWAQQGYRGLFDMGTGTGKTITALTASTKLLKKLNYRMATIIVCPYTHLVEQWVDEEENFNEGNDGENFKEPIYKIKEWRIKKWNVSNL